MALQAQASYIKSQRRQSSRKTAWSMGKGKTRNSMKKQFVPKTGFARERDKPLNGGKLEAI